MQDTNKKETEQRKDTGDDSDDLMDMDDTFFEQIETRVFVKLQSAIDKRRQIVWTIARKAKLATQLAEAFPNSEDAFETNKGSEFLRVIIVRDNLIPEAREKLFSELDDFEKESEEVRNISKMVLIAKMMRTVAKARAQSMAARDSQKKNEEDAERDV